jgi:hypothetical protein
LNKVLKIIILFYLLLTLEENSKECFYNKIEN